MSDHDIQLLAIGASLGAELMVLIQAGFQILDNRRSAAQARAAEAQLQAARERATA